MSDCDDRVKKVAEWCLGNGISVIPISEGGKVPAIKWGDCCDTPLESWDYPECSIAIITGATNKLVVIDCDTEESWLEWEEKQTHTPLRVKSKRGMHYWYSHPDQYVKSDSHIKLEGMVNDYDCKGERSYTLLPCSIIGGHQYSFWPTKDNPRGRFMMPSSLPVFNPAWRPDRVTDTVWEGSVIRNAEAYLSKAYAVEGQGGDKETYRLCRKLKESNVGEAEAMALMAHWNQTNCSPPWAIPDLYRKLKVAYS